MKHRDPELYSGDVDWLLNCAPAILGLRGTMGAVIACIERGAATSSGDHEHVTDEQLGWSNRPNATARWRRLSKLWSATPSWARGILTTRYERCPEQRLPGVEGYLSDLAGVALALCEDEAERQRLLKACEQSRARDVKRALVAAEKAVRAAHRAFYDEQGTSAERWAAA